jgi:hypothetical protein
MRASLVLHGTHVCRFGDCQKPTLPPRGDVLADGLPIDPRADPPIMLYAPMMTKAIAVAWIAQAVTNPSGH